MNMQWKTHAIGRHLVDVPVNAKLKESWTYDRDKYSVVSFPSFSVYKKAMDAREKELRAEKHKTKNSMLVERINLPNGTTIFSIFGSKMRDSLVVLETYHSVGGGKYFLQSISPVFGMGTKQNGIDFIKKSTMPGCMCRLVKSASKRALLSEMP